MKFLLDTDTCIYLIKRKPPAVHQRFAALVPGDIGISSISLAELQFGIEKSRESARNRDALEKFLLPLEIAAFDADSAFEYGKIRHTLQRAGRPIGPLDLLIAAHAVALKARLVTNNTSEFGRIPGLLIENWVSGTEG